MRARGQHWEALDTAEGARFRPMQTMIGPVTTGGMKVPAFLGSSFAFLGGFETMSKMDQGIYAGMEPSEKLAYACGGVVAAGLAEPSAFTMPKAFMMMAAM